MSDKYQNKYRIASARASWWDYGKNAYYFITICTAGRECNLGQIINGNMHLSEIGKIVEEEWYRSFEIRVELFCDTFVIMPNHIHAIIQIDKSDTSVDTHGNAYLEHTCDDENKIDRQCDLKREMDCRLKREMDCHLKQATHCHASLRETKKYGIAKRSPKSISTFVGGFKSVVTRRVNDLRKTSKLPVWQTRFHDRIIRNDEEFALIVNYIRSNPNNWDVNKIPKL